MITRHRRSKLRSRPYYPSKEKLERDINLFRGIRKMLAREQQKSAPLPNENKK